MPPFYHLFFLVSVPSRFVLRPGPYLIHDEASTPDVLAKAEACRARLDDCRGIPLPFRDDHNPFISLI